MKVIGLLVATVVACLCLVSGSALSSGKPVVESSAKLGGSIYGHLLQGKQRSPSALMAIQFTDRDRGYLISPEFALTAELFKLAFMDFAEVDLSHQANREWRANGYRHATFALLTPSAGGDLSILSNVPGTPAKMASYFMDVYVQKLSNPDIENFGIESARQPHLAGLDYVKSGIHNLEEFASNINKIGDDTLDTKSHTYSREEPYQRHEENDNNGVNVLPVPESVSGTTGDAPDIDVTPPDEADVDGECESDADDAHYDAVCSADDAAQRDASAGVSSATVTTSTVADSDPADGTTSSFVDSSHDDVVGMSDQEEPVPRSSKDDYSVRDASSDDSGDAFLGQDASTNAKSDKTDDASGEEMATTLPVCTTASAKVSREVNGGDAPQILTFSDGKEHDVPTVSGAETLSNPLATTVSPQNIHGHGDDDNSIVGEEMGSTDGIDRTIGTSTSKHSTTSDVLDAAEDPNTEGLDREPSSTDHYRRRLVGEINPVATTIPFLPGRQPSRQPRRPTMKVGEQMTRREVLTSGDGGTTLSLAGDASILLKRSPVCPDAETVDPTVSDPLPQNPTPPDVNGEGHDDMEEGASVLLPANRRKVHAVQQKKASTQEQQTNGHHQKMVFLKILLRDFMFGLNMEAQEDGLTLRKNGRWGDEFEAASYESEGIKGPTGAGAGNRKHEEVPDEGAEGMADKSRGKGPAGWFGWRRRRRNSKSGKNLDGEVVMSVSSIGGVEVTYDGVQVLRKSGPYRREWVNRLSRFPWGRKLSTDYELRVVDEGFDIYLGAQRVWGTTLPPTHQSPGAPE